MKCKRGRHYFKAIIVLTLLMQSSACSDKEGGNGSCSERFGDDLQFSLEMTLARYNVPGAALTVKFEDGSTWSGVAGFSCINGPQPVAMQLENHFRIGSVTKTFTGTAVLLLVKDGLMRLDDTLEEWLPGLIPGGDAITVRMLLEHTSGLYDFTWSEEAYLDPFVENLLRVWTPEELVAIAVDNGPIAEPGEVAVYSNTNYVLLGMLIEVASGQDVESFFLERIFQPLGLENTRFPTDPTLPAPYAHGYLDLNGDHNFTADEDATWQHPSSIWTAGALISTPMDLARWLEELLSGTLLNVPLQAERMTFERQIQGFPAGYFGLAVARLDGGIGHTGAVPGYQAVIMRFRQTDFVVYSNGYLMGEDAVNCANRIYAAAVEVVYPGVQVSI